jgi:hypothetical protein
MLFRKVQRIPRYSHPMPTRILPTEMIAGIAQPLLTSQRIFTFPAPGQKIEISDAYWAADSIEIKDDTQIIIKRPNAYLVIIANKITIGKNVMISWENQEWDLQIKPGTQGKIPGTPPRCIYMNGSDGQGAQGAAGNNGKGGFNGIKAPEVEIWTLDINQAPAQILLNGQNGQDGQEGGDGQEGQDGAPGRHWRPEVGGLTCDSGPGNGGNGGVGGPGGSGGYGGNGGHGGRFTLYAPSVKLATVLANGATISTEGGQRGRGAIGGRGGLGGKGGPPGSNRGGLLGPCPTSFGQRGMDGSPGTDRTQDRNPDGTDGGKFDRTQQLVDISTNEFILMFNKPAIFRPEPIRVHVNDHVKLIGKNFINTDKVIVGDTTTISATYIDSGTLECIIPSIEGGQQVSVQVKQANGTLSNKATITLFPSINHAEQNGMTNISNPPHRFVPGDVTLIGTGFADGFQVLVNDEYVSSPPNIKFIDSKKVVFKLHRPYSTVRNPDGELLTIKLLTADGLETNPINIILDTYLMAVFGDSIQWGQGLREDLKFRSIIKNYIKQKLKGREIYETVFAHSGARIGWSDTGVGIAVDGEVPTGYPTIRQQLDAYSGNKDAVDLILVDGGINDVGVTNIIDPTSNVNLVQETKTRCYDDLKFLLDKIAREYKNAKVIVTGYYQIVSDDSDILLLQLIFVGVGLALLGPGGAIVGAILSQVEKDKMVKRSDTFYNESTKNIQNAVNDINALYNNRFFFVDPGFTSDNAIFASKSLLWGLDGDLSADDDENEGGVASSRKQACSSTNAAGGSMTTCEMASIGHPNVKGAQKYANTIIPIIDRIV